MKDLKFTNSLILLKNSIDNHQTLVGIAYNPLKGDTVPYITLQESGNSINKVLFLARKHNIPTIPNRPLCRALFNLKLGSYIPVTLFKAVAIVLCKLEQRMNRDMQG